LLEAAEQPDLGVPATLLDRRPDLQAPRSRVEAADRRAAAAVREWLPSLSPTALVPGRALEVAAPLRAPVRQIGGPPAQPVYAGPAPRAWPSPIIAEAV